MLLPLEILHAVPLATWAALANAHGASRAPKSLEEVRALANAAAPGLARAFGDVRGLASDDARVALFAAARALGVDTAAWAAGGSPAALAASLVARAAKEASIADVVRAARLHLCRRANGAPNRRYTAGPGPAPTVTPKTLAAFAKAILKGAEARATCVDLEARVAFKGERSVAIDVIREAPASCELVRGPRGELTAKTWSAVKVDRVVAARGADGARTLWIATDAPTMLDPYREAAGKALFGEAELFAASPPLPLRALLRSGKALLKRARAGLPRIRDARVVSVVRAPGRHETLIIDGRDVLSAVEREELASEGALLAARIRIDFDDGPADATLRSPNVVDWEPSPHDADVAAFVAAILPDDGERENLVTLAPHDHAGVRWRGATSDATFERLLAKGYFTRSTSRALAHPAAPSAGRTMLAFPLGAGRYYAVPEEGFDAATWLATEADLVTYRLDVVALAAEMARAIGAKGGAPRLIERGTLVDLGLVTIGAAHVRVYLWVAARATEGLGDRLRARSEGAQPVIVTPRGMRANAGCAEVEADALGGQYGEILGAIGKAVGVATLDAWGRAPVGTRLVAERKTERVWLDGVEMTAMAVSARVLARVLAEADGKPVPGAQCDRKLSGARATVGAVKKARTRFVSGAKASYAMAGREPPADLESVIEGTRSGYRLAVKAWVV